MKTTALILSIFTATVASAAPLLQAVPCEGYKEAYEYARDDIEVVAVGKDFCIARYDSSETAPIITAGAVELGSANRDIYIVESYSGTEWTYKPGTETLARFGDSYIVAVEPHLLATNWAGQFEIRKVFDRPIQPPDVTQEYPPIEENPLVREMVNRLNASDYGDFLEGLVDETPSRFTYSPYIEPAADFIDGYMRSAGLTTTRHKYDIEVLWPPYFSNFFWKDELRAEVVDLLRYNFVTDDGGVTWREITPEHTFEEALFFDPNNGVGIDRNCNIYITNDGGATWDFLNSVGESWLIDATFKDRDNWAFLLNYGSYAVTNDGGQNWITGSVGSQERINSSDGTICFSSDTDIWISYRDVWGDSYIFHSTNGGADFSEVVYTGIDPDHDVMRLIMHNNSEGIIYGYGPVYYTNDGCLTWYLSNGSGSFNSVIGFVNHLKGLSFDHVGNGHITYDGGENWTYMDSGFSGPSVNTIAIKDENEYWVAGSDALIAKTTDGGETWETIDIEWTDDDFVAENVIAELRGKTTPEQIYIICAHYDSVSGDVWYSAPGAEDNGSGTAGVLHLAKIMSQYDFASTIRFCTWSGEEEGLLGSEAYASEAFDRGDDIRAVYNIDMISYMDDDIYDTTIAYENEFVDILTACQEASGIYVPQLTLYPDEGGGGSDHVSFLDFGYPAIMAIEYAETWDDFYPWYHTTYDTYDHLRYDYGVLNVKLGAALIGSLAKPLSGPNFNAGGVYAYPNPIRPDTDFITFANVPGGSEIEIYTITGDRVATVYERNLEARWYLRNNAGGEVASGVYLYYLDTGTDTKIGKIAVLH